MSIVILSCGDHTSRTFGHVAPRIHVSFCNFLDTVSIDFFSPVSLLISFLGIPQGVLMVSCSSCSDTIIMRWLWERIRVSGHGRLRCNLLVSL